MPRDLVIEADAVVAHADGAVASQFELDGGGESMFWHAMSQRMLRQDPGQQHALGIRQGVGRGLAVQHQRFADLLQRGVGPHTRKLRGPVAPRHPAEGFVIVPVEGGLGHALAR
jgi:hypothetical protein